MFNINVCTVFTLNGILCSKSMLRVLFIQVLQCNMSQTIYVFYGHCWNAMIVVVIFFLS